MGRPGATGQKTRQPPTYEKLKKSSRQKNMKTLE